MDLQNLSSEKAAKIRVPEEKNFFMDRREGKREIERERGGGGERERGVDREDRERER